MEGSIKGHEQNFSIQPDGRCKCLLNGHVFPNNPQAVASFISGRRYRQICESDGGIEKGTALQGYEPYLTQSRNFTDRLFCRLTCRLLKRDVKAVKKYVEGRRFQQTKELHEKGEHELMSEPDVESDEEGQHADASEQTGQIADGSSPSPCDSMEESMETENLRAEDGSRSSQAVDLKTDVAKRQQRVRPPRPKRQKHADAE
ncbi:g7450 [Coccomyxa viridis]|uniref:G7450 protein n=1 Tax=Coccomyxa viridis TaxID=1274662 RepID=A0ABP1FXX6_9CHLO